MQQTAVKKYAAALFWMAAWGFGSLYAGDLKMQNKTSNSDVSGDGRVVEAELREDVTEAFANPQAAGSLPRVLIIGDSISIGYTEPVRQNLRGIAAVFRPSGNCQDTGVGVAQIKNWLGTSQWDVIHFNFGIWDTHLLDAQGNLVRGENKPGFEKILASGVRLRHSPEQYRENLIKLVEILKGTGARLIWASSTPIMYYRQGERLEVIPTLNRVAAEVMQSHGVAINDLYAFVMPHVKEWQSADQAHFTDEGYQQLAQQVSECIKEQLSRAK